MIQDDFDSRSVCIECGAGPGVQCHELCSKHLKNTQPERCCCGQKWITSPLIINDTCHETPGGDRFCGPVYAHTIRNLIKQKDELHFQMEGIVNSHRHSSHVALTCIADLWFLVKDHPLHGPRLEKDVERAREGLCKIISEVA